MEREHKNSFKQFFYRFSAWVTRATGRPAAFLIALLTVIIWAVSGHFFHYSENWQLVINTGTTIITFLMIFIIQQSQNRDTTALHIKLNELIATNREASNTLVASEDLTEEELEVIKKYYKGISENTSNSPVFASQSADENENDPVDKTPTRKANQHLKTQNKKV